MYPETAFISFAGTVLAVICALIWWAVAAENRNFLEFMKQCQEDRKEYECYAMWRAGQSQVTPVPIIIPVR